MSLYVWLPLTGDLHNQGTSNISIENMGAVTSNASGKIGSCMSFTGAATSYLRLSPILSTGDCSIAFWAKLNSSSTAHTFYSQRTAANSTGFTIFSLTSGNLRFDDGSALEVAGIGTNVWHHVVCCRDSVKKYIYVDGVLKGSAAKGNPSPNVNYSLIGGSQNTVGGSASQGTTNALNGYLNDVRIYDHCLSVAEIHEIAQGLVLHYKLDNQYESGLQNKYSSPYSDGYCSSSSWTQTQLTNERGWNYKLNKTGNGNNDWPYCRMPVFTFTPGKRYYYSAKIRCHTWTAGTLSLRASRSNNDYVTNTVVVCSAALADGQWHEYSVSQIIDETYVRSGTTITCAPRLEFYTSNLNGNGTIYNMDFDIKDAQVVESDTYVPFIDNSMSSSIITDSSGYGHNGTVTGTLALSNNTPRYSASSQFVAGTKIAGSGFVTSQSPTFTLSYWIHMDGGTYTKWADTVSFTGNKTFRQETNNTAGTSLGWYNYPLGTTSGTGGTTVALNTWTHLALVSNGTNFYFYKNGALYSTVALTGTAWTPDGNFTLGDASNMFMRMSDFRLYCTALSAADILSLYHTGAKVDNLGGAHAFEINENKVNKLTKTGILYDNLAESIMTLPDGSHWQLLLFHYVDGGKNLFTQSNAAYCNEFGLFSRLKYIDNFKLNNQYEFYAIQDDIEYRWIQTNAPTASTIAGLTTVSGYANPVNGLAKATNQDESYLGYSTWWGACGSWTSYTTGGKTGIPGFGAHNVNGICTHYLALYARISNIDTKLANETVNTSNFIEL